MKAGTFLSVKFDGLAHVRSALEALPVNVQKRVQKFAMKKAAKSVVDRAKALAPVRSGRLRDSIKVKGLKRKRKTSIIGVRIGPDKGFYQGDQYYAAFIEFGYSATERYRVGNQWMSKRRGTATTPVEAKPFLRPAMDQSKSEVMRIFREQIKSAVDRATVAEARKRRAARAEAV